MQEAWGTVLEEAGGGPAQQVQCMGQGRGRQGVQEQEGVGGLVRAGGGARRGKQETWALRPGRGSGPGVAWCSAPPGVWGARPSAQRCPGQGCDTPGLSGWQGE